MLSWKDAYLKLDDHIENVIKAHWCNDNVARAVCKEIQNAIHATIMNTEDWNNLYKDDVDA